VIGMISLADLVRDHSLRTVKRLKGMSGIKRIAMLTEEDEGTAAGVAEYLGLDEYHAGLSPAEKVHMIQAWQKESYRVGVVGNPRTNAALLSEADLAIG